MSDISRVLRAPDRERNRIRKEYESRKALEGKLGIDKLKDFRDLAVSVFTVFTDITGQKVNAEAMTAHIAYYLDEGFEVPEMIAYMRSEWETNSYFVETPANFTISRLFPIKDTDRIQMTWDLLAFHQAQVAKGRGKYAEIAEEKVRIGKCTHITTRQFYEKSGICETCLLLGSKWEILKDPAVALALLPEDQTEMRAMATWFLRDPMVDFNLADYWERTYPLRAEIWKEFGKKLNAKNPFISFGMK